MKLLRQGDILLVEIEDMPRASKQDGPCILAYGEATGHAHKIEEGAEIWVDLNDVGKRYLRVLSETKLDHEEHGRIALTRGIYEIVRQREYIPGNVRTVAD